MGALDRFGLDGKVVMVTGAGRGIGRVIALDASRSGARLAIGSRTSGELEAVAGEISESGGECFHQGVDVTQVESIERFVDAVIDRYGRIDVLINNAGWNRHGPLLEATEEDFGRILDANLKSVFFCSRIVARRMIARGEGGAIVNLSSQAGVVGAPGRGAYSAAKAGVNNLTRTMAAEWAPFGIRVNAVAPTVTRTPLAARAMEENPAFAGMVRANNLLRGDLAEPEEISAPVIFLASPASSMITGHTLVVDGGWTIV
jgi:NAD(P)-dependent dehydrogenase (short-subunit alcohol dehydrogenase family)